MFYSNLENSIFSNIINYALFVCVCVCEKSEHECTASA